MTEISTSPPLFLVPHAVSNNNKYCFIWQVMGSSEMKSKQREQEIRLRQIIAKEKEVIIPNTNKNL